MITQTLREYAIATEPCLKTEGPELALALSLIHEQRALDINSPAVRHAKLSLEALVRALLSYSAHCGFLKYDPWDPTITVKHFPEDYLIYQYNPFREPSNRRANGQKAGVAAAGAKPDFLAWETFPENEHYLVWTASSGRRFGILVQPVPIVPAHLIIASLDPDPRTQQHASQVMRYYLLADMHELQEELFVLGYALGFNAQGAGASVDHFHMQAVPASLLPLVQAWNANQVGASQTHGDAKGVTMKIIGTENANSNPGIAYAVPGFVLESERRKILLTKKQAILKGLEAHGIIFNSLAWQQPNGRYAEAYFPRGQESVMQNAFKAGYVEMSGMLVIPGKSLYDGILDARQGREGLRPAGLSAGDFHRFLEDIYHYFVPAA